MKKALGARSAGRNSSSSNFAGIAVVQIKQEQRLLIHREFDYVLELFAGSRAAIIEEANDIL